MKITLNDHILSGGYACNEIPKDLKIEGQDITQLGRVLDSPFINTYNRGNHKTRVRFSIERTHPSHEAALWFALTHASQLQGIQGTLLLELESSINESEFRLQNAVIEKVTSSPIDNKSLHTYSIIGGRLF